MRQATAYSVNTYFVELERRVGLCETVQAAEALGVRTAGRKASRPVRLVHPGRRGRLPADDGRGLRHAGGERRPLRLARDRLDDHPRRAPSSSVPPKRCEQAIDSAVADGVTSLLAGVIDGPITGRTGAAMSLGRPAAGKTGTTEENAAVWFCGYTRELATVVWVGDPRGGQRYPLRNITINGHVLPRRLRRHVPRTDLETDHAGGAQGRAALQLPRRSTRRSIKGVTVQVPNLTGLDPTNAVAQLESLGPHGLDRDQAGRVERPRGHRRLHRPRRRVERQLRPDDHHLRQHRRAAAAQAVEDSRSRRPHRTRRSRPTRPAARLPDGVRVRCPAGAGPRRPPGHRRHDR